MGLDSSKEKAIHEQSGLLPKFSLNVNLMEQEIQLNQPSAVLDHLNLRCFDAFQKKLISKQIIFRNHAQFITQEEKIAKFCF